MAEIRRLDGRPVIDYTARDYESLLQAMRGLIPGKLPEWRDFANEADFGAVLLELFAYLGDILSYYQDRVANESFLGTARTRRAVIEHLRLIGYELGTAAPAATRLSLSVPASVTDTVVVAKGSAFATRSQRDRASVRFEYAWDTPLSINFGAIVPDPASGRKIYGDESTGIPVVEGRYFAEEVLGVSDGSANQRFPLARSGLILRPGATNAQANRDVVLVTQLGTGVDTWTLRDSLAFSQTGQRDYVVEIDAEDRATVVFGDGGFGAIPPSGATVKASYRVGGGSRGNVPAGAITTIVDATPLALLGARVSNPGAATGGADREDVAHAVRNAPAIFRSLHRAVTAADYEALARGFQGVGKVRAGATAWNRVTLYVAPSGGGKVSDVLEAGLIAYFEDKRMLSQVVEVADVDYVPVYVTVGIEVESCHVRTDVVARVQQAVGALLAFDRVDFGQTIYLSKFYEEAQGVPGVVYVDVTEFRRGDRPYPSVESNGKLVLLGHEVPVIPDEAGYAPGVRVEIIEQGG